jgi:hypothetical protein
MKHLFSSAHNNSYLRLRALVWFAVRGAAESSSSNARKTVSGKYTRFYALTFQFIK